MNQSARRDDTRRDAPLHYVRPASYCEPGFKPKVAVFKAILLTIEPHPTGPTFARCAFMGGPRGTKWTGHGYKYIYIYIPT